jgi:hypothetical protein
MDGVGRLPTQVGASGLRHQGPPGSASRSPSAPRTVCALTSGRDGRISDAARRSVPRSCDTVFCFMAVSHVSRVYSIPLLNHGDLKLGNPKIMFTHIPAPQSYRSGWASRRDSPRPPELARELTSQGAVCNQVSSPPLAEEIHLLYFEDESTRTASFGPSPSRRWHGRSWSDGSFFAGGKTDGEPLAAAREGTAHVTNRYGVTGTTPWMASFRGRVSES